MADPIRMPPLRELGPELLRIPRWRQMLSLLAPFFWCGAYFALALADCWSGAVFALIALSFVTYGSTSHDLVHRNLALSRTTNDILLCVIELLALRSGHAYQAAHLHHHARFRPPPGKPGGAHSRSALSFRSASGFGHSAMAGTPRRGSSRKELRVRCCWSRPPRLLW
jgi:beta-carotene hydroxylase